MTRNIMTGEGIRPVEAVTEFEVSGIKLFTQYDLLADWCVTESSCGLDLCYGKTESEAIESAKATIANIGPDKIIKKVRAMVERFGVANKEV